MSFLARLFGGNTVKQRFAAAVELARAGRHDEAAAAWLRVLEQTPLLMPSDAQLAALEPVLPRVARKALDGLLVPTKHSKLERRGSFDGEERWRLEQDRHWPMAELEPTLRYLALLVAHTTAAPGRVRIDCDRPNPDSEAYLPTEQMGEAIATWDSCRRLTGLRIEE